MPALAHRIQASRGLHEGIDTIEGRCLWPLPGGRD